MTPARKLMTIQNMIFLPQGAFYGRSTFIGNPRPQIAKCYYGSVGETEWGLGVLTLFCNDETRLQSDRISSRL